MKFKIALCQIGESLEQDARANKEDTWSRAEAKVREAAANDAEVVALPEMWNCPYSGNHFREYAEEINTDDTGIVAGGLTALRMSQLARELGVYLVGGTIPELVSNEDSGEDRVYNTCCVFGRDGRIIARHRKAHLFDVNIKGGVTFKESDTLTAGDSATVFDTEFGTMGVAICYDIRFPEFFRRMEVEGAKIIFLPAAFSAKTGAAHWDLLMRCRAVDYQCYLAAVSPARVEDARYKAYGHSCVSDPWGGMTIQAGENETLIYADIDTEYVDEVRRQMPFLEHMRPELY